LKGKMGFKKGQNGFIYTFNKNPKSKRKAYLKAKNSYTK